MSTKVCRTDFVQWVSSGCRRSARVAEAGLGRWAIAVLIRGLQDTAQRATAGFPCCCHPTRCWAPIHQRLTPAPPSSLLPTVCGRYVVNLAIASVALAVMVCLGTWFGAAAYATRQARRSW